MNNSGFGPSADPEEYSWEVRLGEDQELKQIDEQHAAVYHDDGTMAFGIDARPAHDVVGTSVPTSLSVPGENVVTLIVHHRAGNPVKGGAPFQYPITEGMGWEGGFETGSVVMPPAEQPPRVAQEDAEGECRVPRLHGLSAKASARRLREAGCTLGKVRGERSKAARVVKQNVVAGRRLPVDTRISVKLAD